MKRELRLFFTALSFYSRIPVPVSVHEDNGRDLPDAIRYLPVVGWIAGLIAAILFMVTYDLFGSTLALLFSMAGTVLLTGAFHEDGFADVCDGFGGGWTKERILLIMKDSRLGTYGVTGLIFILAIKFAVLQQLTDFSADRVVLLLSFVVAHSLSRFAAITLVFTYQYARIEESKAGSAVEKGKTINLVIAAVFAFLPLAGLAFYCWQPLLPLVVIPVLLAGLLLGNYFKKWIGGYTGDCLGAVQQITEIIIYLTLAGIWKFT